MFAALQASPAVPLAALVEVARAFTPRFQVVGPFVLLDVGGLSALFGSAPELGAALQAQRPDCGSMALASTASRALLLACGRPGLTVLAPADEPATVAALPIAVLVDVARTRVEGVGSRETGVGRREPGFSAEASLEAAARSRDGTGHGSAGEATAAALVPSIGWRHPRDTHQAQHTRRPRASAASPAVPRASRATARPLAAIEPCASALDRWGIRTVGALSALPRAAVHARLGELGVSWQRLASGEDDEPLVPWVAEPVFEETLELEWPVEGFEPLSFVLARLFEPLAAALERADRGAVSIRTALHLTTRAVHLRQLPLPAPMRDPKTLRTLVLLDLESHPPGAPIDRVQVRVEPTPGRVLQWTLLERAQPAPEQVATLVARLTALVGEGHVGSPALADTWRPGAFRMEPFRAGRERRVHPAPLPPAPVLPLALRRFRLPVPVRVRVEDGRPVRLTTDRHGLTSGAVVQAAGPWRTSGEWWATEPCRASEERPRGELREEKLESRGSVSAGGSRQPEVQSMSHHEALLEAAVEPDRLPAPDSPLPTRSAAWDRDEWDIAMADGTVYRLSVEREVGQWFLEGVFD
ncbi:MAG: hypothetical protein IT179_21660 [Acidobacteria bacterium]|nr:hypothetical protein [Acidobacteriota bacterium]